MKNIYSFILSDIPELNSIRDQKAKLLKRESEITSPILTDLSLIDILYEWFVEINPVVTENKADITESRKKFIFIVLFFYSPGVFTGSKINKGIREKIASLFQCTPSNISHCFSNIGFLYKMYKDFSKDVDMAYGYIVGKLEAIGIAC